MKNCHLQLWACVASRDMTASLKSLAQGRVRVARQPSPLSTQTIDPRPALCGSARANQSQFRTCGMRLCSCRRARAAPWPCGSFSTVRWAWRHTRPPCPSSPAFTWTCRPRARPSLPWRTPRCVCMCLCMRVCVWRRVHGRPSRSQRADAPLLTRMSTHSSPTDIRHMDQWFEKPNRSSLTCTFTLPLLPRIAVHRGAWCCPGSDTGVAAPHGNPWRRHGLRVRHWG